MNNNERAAHWQKQISQWQKSGLSGAQFCKQHELDLSQFYYWSKKHSRKRFGPEQDANAMTGFATVVATDAPAYSEGLRFTLPNGCTIEGITRDNVSLVGVMLAQL